jgi:serine/threonine protein kinase
MISPTKPTRGATDLDIVKAALVGEYEVLEELGRGGMAIVYRARELMLDREVAIKVLPFTLAFDDAFVERFVREARISARLEHPHIIPIHRVGQAGQVTYFAMKLLRGQSLSDRLLEHGSLTPAETRRILTEAASALGYAHSQGVVHRDVKPDNMFLDDAGRCVVTDFGIARSGSDAKLTGAGMSVGTPHYMSPEQARATDVDGRSDIYSLGVVGFECLTGRTPFDGGDPFAILLQHISSSLPKPDLPSEEARSLFTVIEKMLAKQPSDRFANAEELVEALQSETAVPPMHATAQTAAQMIAKALGSARTLVERHFPNESSFQSLPKLPTLAKLAKAAKLNPRIAAGAAAGLLVLGAAAYGATHLAAHDGSRCPHGSPAPFLVKVDDGTVRQGRRADLYYDVCGLPASSPYTTHVTITRQGRSLGKLFGHSSSPVTATYEETASGPSVRRHHTLGTTSMPSGTYHVEVLVTDDRGRHREDGASLVVRPRE